MASEMADIAPRTCSHLPLAQTASRQSARSPTSVSDSAKAMNPGFSGYEVTSSVMLDWRIGADKV